MLIRRNTRWTTTADLRLLALIGVTTWALLMVLTPLASSMSEPPIQGYRLVIPGQTLPLWMYNTLVPYRWWEQIGAYKEFTECEETKMGLRQEAQDVLGPGARSPCD